MSETIKQENTWFLTVKADFISDLEKQLESEKSLKASIELKAADLQTKIELLQYDLQEAVNSRKLAVDQQEKAEAEVS